MCAIESVFCPVPANSFPISSENLHTPEAKMIFINWEQYLKDYREGRAAIANGRHLQ